MSARCNPRRRHPDWDPSFEDARALAADVAEVGDIYTLLAVLRDISDDLHVLVQLRDYALHRLIGAGRSFRFAAEAASLSPSAVHKIVSAAEPTGLSRVPLDPQHYSLRDALLAERIEPDDIYGEVWVTEIAKRVTELIAARDLHAAAARLLRVPVRQVAQAAGLSVGGVTELVKRVERK